jgi:hypothetical protein
MLKARCHCVSKLMTSSVEFMKRNSNYFCINMGLKGYVTNINFVLLPDADVLNNDRWSLVFKNQIFDVFMVFKRLHGSSDTTMSSRNPFFY